MLLGLNIKLPNRKSGGGYVPVPSNKFIVKNSAGTEYTVTLAVRNSSGVDYAVPVTVKTSGGVEYYIPSDESLYLDYTIPSDGTPGVVPGFYQVDNVSGVLTQTTFSSLITFSRASNATRFSPTGQLQYAPHNLLLQSQTFDNASWTKSNSSITANAATAPDGTITADKEIPANGVAGTYIAQGFSATSGTTYTYTVYAKASEFSELRLLGEGAAFGSNTTGVYNLSTGVASVAAGSPTVSMTSVGNGWWRCVWTATATATTTGVVQQRINTTGDGTSGLFIWGAQLSVGPNALDYTPTTTAVVYGPRFDYNPTTLAAKGLLIEEQRTNSIRNNTMVGASAPSTLPTNWGNNSLSGISIGVGTPGIENGISYVDLTFSGTAGATLTLFVGFDTVGGIAALDAQTWTHTAYIKQTTAVSLPNINLGWRTYTSGSVLLGVATVAITVAGNASNLSATRQTYTATLSGATIAFIRPTLEIAFSTGVAYNFTLRIGLPQLEQGAFATSVIPTTTAATTRSADIASIGTLSPWYNATEGTLYAEFTASANANTVYTAISNGATNQNSIYFDNDSGVIRNVVFSSNSAQAAISTGVIGTIGAVNKLAGAYKVNDFAVSRNGAAAVTDTAGNVPVSPSQLDIGRNPNAVATTYVSGYLRRITYTPRRLTNAELQSLTS